LLPVPTPPCERPACRESEPIDGVADEGVCRSEAAGGQLITASVVSTVVSLFLVSCSRLR